MARPATITVTSRGGHTPSHSDTVASSTVTEALSAGTSPTPGSRVEGSAPTSSRPGTTAQKAIAVQPRAGIAWPASVAADSTRAAHMLHGRAGDEAAGGRWRAGGSTEEVRVMGTFA